MDPTLDFVSEIKEALVPVLDRMRNWQGEAYLEAQFGRILIRNIPATYAAPGDRENSHDREWLAAALNIKGGELRSPSVDFTNLVTTTAGDIKFIHTLRSNGKMMWQTKPYTWKVVYQIECIDTRSSMRYHVEIDAERFTYETKSLPIALGKVLVHGMIRNWDYAITSIGHENLEKKYGEIGKEIVDSLYIP
jgi:hypothetical protein